MSDYRGKNLISPSEIPLALADGMNDKYRIPQHIDVDCSEHDIKYKTKICELQECIAKQSELIRGYDEEILKLKAQCRELTQNERLAYKRCNGNATEIPTQPIKIADWLIDKYFGEELMTKDIAEMEKDSLRQIAEHLLVFCRGDLRLR